MTSLQKKIELRKNVLKKRQDSDKKILSRLSGKILARLEKTEEFKKAETVLLYAPIKNEVNTLPLIRKYLGRKKILLPRINPNWQISIHQINSLKEAEKNTYDIMEPGSHCKSFSSKKINLAVIPGIAFGTKGERLGFGKGCYDRLLSNLTVPKIGLAYDFQIIEDIPTETHDQKMDMILTETRTIKYF